jgi:hypothetical protein
MMALETAAEAAAVELVQMAVMEEIQDPQTVHL